MLSKAYSLDFFILRLRIISPVSLLAIILSFLFSSRSSTTRSGNISSHLTNFRLSSPLCVFMHICSPTFIQFNTLTAVSVSIKPLSYCSMVEKSLSSAVVPISKSYPSTEKSVSSPFLFCMTKSSHSLSNPKVYKWIEPLYKPFIQPMM